MASRRAINLAYRACRQGLRARENVRQRISVGGKLAGTSFVDVLIILLRTVWDLADPSRQARPSESEREFLRSRHI
jgi:hypothetical protein